MLYVKCWKKFFQLFFIFFKFSVKELGLKIARKILDEENSHLVHCNWLFVLTNTDLRWVPTNPTQLKEKQFENPQFLLKASHYHHNHFSSNISSLSTQRKSFRDLLHQIKCIYLWPKTKKKNVLKNSLRTEQSYHHDNWV